MLNLPARYVDCGRELCEPTTLRQERDEMRLARVMAITGLAGLLVSSWQIVNAQAPVGPCGTYAGGPCWCTQDSSGYYYYCTGYQYEQASCQNLAGNCAIFNSCRCYTNYHTTRTACYSGSACCSQNPIPVWCYGCVSDSTCTMNCRDIGDSCSIYGPVCNPPCQSGT